MNDYKQRGRIILVLAVAVTLFSIVSFCFEKTNPYGSGFLGIATVFWVSFIVQRRMTPAQFEQKRKREKQDNDERKQVIAGKACQITCLVMLASIGAAILYFAIFTENDAATWAMIGQLIIFIAVLCGSSAVLQHKM